MVATANATPTATGIYVGIIGAKYYMSICEFFRNEGQNQTQQSEFFSKSSHAWSIGANIGGGYEFLCNMYVGVNGFVVYNTAEIVRDEKDPGKIIKFTPGGTEHVFSITAYAASIKPRLSYGIALWLGYKIFPNLLIYLSLGVDFTNVAFSQSFIGIPPVGANEEEYEVFGFSQGSAISQTIADLNNKDVNYAVTMFDNGSVKGRLIGFKPGLGARLFLSKNIFIGAEASLFLGYYKALDIRYFTQSGRFKHVDDDEDGDEDEDDNDNDNELDVMSLDAMKAAVYSKGFGFRLGLNIGLKL
jgi:hypothetical protein